MSLRPRSLARRSLAAPTLVATAFALAACGGAAPPTPPPAGAIPAYPGPFTRAHKASSSSSSSRATDSPAAAFAALRDRILDQWLRDDPAFARELGLHDFDGKVADYSAAAITARIARLEQDRQALAGVNKASLSADDALDLALLTREVDISLFRLVDLVEWQRRPQFYKDMFEIDAYLVREYAPLEERVKKLLEHEKAALAQVPHIQANLKSPMSRAVVATVIKSYKGYAEYLRGDVLTLTKGVGDAAFQDDLRKTGEALAQKAIEVATFLEGEVKKGDDSHVLGKARFEKLLAVQEGLSTPLAELEAMGEQNLAENKKAYEALAKKTKLTRPKQEALFDEATRIMDASRAFVIDKKLVTIPTEDKAVAKETPPFMRWNSAFLNPPGAFETRAKTAFYYITLPDPTWKKKEQIEYVMPLGILLSTTVHEAYPGHFLQNQWIQRAPTRAQKMLGSYSFIEGWAHYAEQMIVEEGFGAEDPQNRLGQLSDALLRNCRFVVSIGVHTKGLSLAKAEQRFATDCKQDKATAREQAARATFDPGYFAYTLGKLQILELRAEAKRRLGASFDARRFHDALLSHGSPQVPLIRERVLEEIGAR